jgi:hypothetical protein
MRMPSSDQMYKNFDFGMSALQTCILVLAITVSSNAKKGTEGPVYLLEDNISPALEETNVQYQERNRLSPENPSLFSEEDNYEWESYDGWYNNPAHPEWGGYGEFCLNDNLLWESLMCAADMPLERKTPIAYPDGVYEIIPEQARANALLVSNISQHGISGLGAKRRTAFFTFFGKFTQDHQV